MGKRHSRPSIQAWISRESPEGGCVIINDTSSQTRLLEEILKQKRTVTSYEGYLVNEEDNLDPGVLTDHHSSKSKSVESFPIEIVDLPAEPDGKQIDIHFVKEGNMDETTQTAVKPEDIDCGVSIRSMSSDRQQWSFSLYNFEDNGRISKEDLTKLVKSIYDALGKSVDKANRKNSRDAVKKVKVHISLSKEKTSREMRGAAVVPRREVVVGAEDRTAENEKQLERLKLRDSSSSQEAVAKKSKRRKEGCSTVQVLNNDLGNARLTSGKCKCCSNTRENKKKSQTEKNSNLLADKPNLPARRKTEPGGCFTPEQKPGQELAQLTETKLKVRSQRRTRRRSASPGGHMPGLTSPGGHISPVVHTSGNHSPVGHLSGYTSPVPITGGSREVPLDPSYAYHAEKNNYVYMHAAPRQTPFEEPKYTRRHTSKHRRPRDGGEKPSGIPSYPGGTSTVHRHEHVHHHYHHYGEKR